MEFASDCDTYNSCPFGEDGILCRGRYQVCENYLLSFTRDVLHVVCRISIMKSMYFSLEIASLYPSIENKNINHIDQWSMEYNIMTNNIKSEPDDITWAWRCNRGLYARFWLGNNDYSYKCFCPPSYFGDFC